MTNGCCNEYGCRRATPILVRQGWLTGRWYAITRHRLNHSHPHLIVATQKHDVTDSLIPALIDAGWTPPPEADDATD